MIGASVPWSPLWQGLLTGLGWVLAQIYNLVPNYGITIIILTVLIRVLLLPLGIKQVKSMQRMQALQPRVKTIQQRYKGNKQKIQEETMKLYQELGVSPFSGCWPMLLQMPILISMYSVLRFPQHPSHLPASSELRQQVALQIPETPPKKAPPPTGTAFLFMNLLCPPLQAGSPSAALRDPGATKAGQRVAASYPIDCGAAGRSSRDFPAAIPYYLVAGAMIVTTYYSSRQMQKASPPGAQSQQQQAIQRIMPLTFGFFAFIVPVGLVLYWTISNLWQIGQQHFVLKAAAHAPTEPPKPAKAKRGFMSRMMEQAQTERARREGGAAKAKPKGQAKPKPKPKPGGKPSGSQRKPGSGGGDGGSRKKRPKR